ncbi:MAG: non-canonical purine NTP diphosphatase [Candidatus Symbiothrix sp.]|jgi:XTP/dITP diphosphohydrolase|nr:non-canonical purine NTP diphosphatase [Candidatus Symbiothrix sp.]
MTTLVFATNNGHKLQEVRDILGDQYKIVSLQDIDCVGEIPETADTLEGNALLKARFIHKHYGYTCFADDTGLEVTVLNNQPGVHSARYAGEEKNDQANRTKLIKTICRLDDRSARFRTVIALIKDGKEYLFEGIIKGQIVMYERGEGGFGYDSIFVPDGYKETFAEMPGALKNSISHRANAIHKLRKFLNETQ